MGKIEVETCYHDTYGRKKMNTGVVFKSKKIKNSLQGVAKTTGSFAEIDGRTHGGGIRTVSVFW